MFKATSTAAALLLSILSGISTPAATPSACNAAVPETGQEIADAMPGLDLRHPDIHAKLTDGAFDAMTSTDKIATLLEIWRRAAVVGGMDVVQADALVASSLDILKDHPIPPSAIHRAFKRALANYRPKTHPHSPNDTAQASDPITWWYAYSDNRCINFMYRIKDTAFADACSVCNHSEGPSGGPVAVMNVTTHSVGGNCVVCANDCP